MSIPNTLNRHPADALRFSHRADTPVSGASRGRVQSGLHDCPHFFLGDTWNTPWPRGVFLQSFQTKGKKAFPPQLDRRSGNRQRLRNVLTRDTLRRHHDNFRTFNQSQRESSPRLQVLNTARSSCDNTMGEAILMLHNIAFVLDISQANYGTVH